MRKRRRQRNSLRERHTERQSERKTDREITGENKIKKRGILAFDMARDTDIRMRVVGIDIKMHAVRLTAKN